MSIIFLQLGNSRPDFRFTNDTRYKSFPFFWDKETVCVVTLGMTLQVFTLCSVPQRRVLVLNAFSASYRPTAAIGSNIWCFIGK